MVRVHFPPHLRRHIAVPAVCSAEGETVADLVAHLESKYPGVASYLIDERGAARQHVNFFVGGQLIQDRWQLSDVIDGRDVHIMQALSGG